MYCISLSALYFIYLSDMPYVLYVSYVVNKLSIYLSILRGMGQVYSDALR